MATAGRVRHHLKHNLWDPRNSLVFVGYQAQGTLGRIILNGAKTVKVLGEQVAVQAQVHDIEGFSGHADQIMLLDWIRKFKVKPRKVFIVHGEGESTTSLARLIEKEFKIRAIIPDLGDSFSLEKRSMELASPGKEALNLQEDIERELAKVYRQFKALEERKEELVKESLLEKEYDNLKNTLIELQENLMDLNMSIGK